MKTFIISIFFLSFCSCNSEKNAKTSQESNNPNLNQEVNKENSLIKPIMTAEINNEKQPDSIQIFNVDDYPLRDEMFKGNYGLKKSGEIVSFDQVWFTNQTLNQTLVIELYTDYHRIVTYHFDAKAVPVELINRMELHVEGGELATKEQKVKYFNGLIEQSIQTDKSNFISIKGVSIGMPRKKANDLYGIPDKQEISDEFEVLEWEFIGDVFYDDKVQYKKKTIAKDSYGHSVTMFFKNDRLVGQILFNDIP